MFEKMFIRNATRLALATAIAATASAAFVYEPSEWPAINGPVGTGSGAPAPHGNPSFSAQVKLNASGLPPVRSKTENPQTGGVCPVGDHGVGGSCWWTCGFGADGFPCAGRKDVKTCEAGKWGLTYDDGPTQLTGEMLDILKANNLKATFCLVGSQVVRFPEQAKRIADEGHDLCIHSWSHSALTTQTNDEVIAELKYTELAIERVTGVKAKYVRPPYGDIDNRIRAITDAMGYRVLLWNFDTSDFKSFPGGTGATVDQLMVEVNSNLNSPGKYPNGSLSLGHPEKASVGIELAQKFIRAASGKVKLVPASVCLNEPAPLQVSSASSTSLRISAAMLVTAAALTARL